MQYIGIDCALRTFGYAKITINVENLAGICDMLNHLHENLSEIYNQLNDITCELDKSSVEESIKTAHATINNIKHAIKTFLVCDAIGVVDILQGKTISDVSDSQRVCLLREWLDQSPINNNRNTNITRVSIELQPPKIGAHTTHHSENVSMQLAMYYCSPGFSFAFTDPKHKKLITLVDYNSVLQRISEERAIKRINSVKYTDDKLHYKANKIHAAECLDVCEKYFSLNCNINKSLRNHCADALLMAILLFQSDILHEEEKKKQQKKKKKRIITAIDSSNILV